jgi:hypothetical protein
MNNFQFKKVTLRKGTFFTWIEDHQIYGKIHQTALPEDTQVKIIDLDTDFNTYQLPNGNIIKVDSADEIRD